ncbi:MAG: hypothetical protein ACYTGZ_17705 [Planctomycetota bacterium]|jgi:hypothetical protein
MPGQSQPRLLKFGPAVLPFVLVGFIVLVHGTPTTAQDMGGMGAPPPKANEKLRKADKGCVSCHSAIEVMHPWDPLSCTDCHGGDGNAKEKDDAHVPATRSVPNDERTVGLKVDLKYRRFVNPTDLRVVDITCGKCHSDECANLPKSLHGTTAGHLSDGLYENGVIRNPKKRFAIFPVKDDDGIVPEHGYKSMPALPLPTIARPNEIGQHFQDLPRKSCMQCHLYSRGIGLRGRLGQDGWYRSEGCAACHVTYEADGLSRSKDPMIDKLEPGHPRAHRMTSKIPTETCTVCHALDANIGMSFRGLAQLPPGVPGGPDVPGTTDKLSKGAFFLNDPNICPPDVHYERGMHCVDCHNATDTMGDGNIYGEMEYGVGISCATCHGTYSQKADFKNTRGELLDNLQWKNGEAILTGRVDGKTHLVKQVVDVIKIGGRHYNAKAAKAMDPVKHGRLECYACHSGWSVNFFGFHFDRNESFTQLDILSGKRTPGRVTTNEKIFATFKHYYLGVNSEGRIAPYMVGFSTAGTWHDAKGNTALRQALPVTAKGLSGMTLIHHQLHTVRPAARTCAECHGAPSVLGCGSENFHLFRDFFVTVGDAGLTVCGLDVRNPEKSIAIANVPLPSIPRHVALLNSSTSGKMQYAYVACRNGTVQVVDVTDPVRPKRVGQYDAGDARRVHVRENLMFVAAGEQGLHVVSLANPKKPRKIASVSTTEARSVFIDGIHAYVADGPGGMRIVDISVPNKPAVVKVVDLNGVDDPRSLDANDVIVHFTAGRPVTRDRRRSRAANLAYVADGTSGIYVVDVTHPEAPRLVPVFGRRGQRAAFSATALAFASSYDIGSAGGDIPSAEREYLYVVGTNLGNSNGTLLKFDVTRPDRATLAGTRRTVNDPRGVRIARVYQPPFLKQYAIIAGRGQGDVEIADVTPRQGQIAQVALIAGVGRSYGIDIEMMPLDRLTGIDGKPLKDVSHLGARYLTRKEIERILRAEVR